MIGIDGRLGLDVGLALAALAVLALAVLALAFEEVSELACIVESLSREARDRCRPVGKIHAQIERESKSLQKAHVYERPAMRGRPVCFVLLLGALRAPGAVSA